MLVVTGIIQIEKYEAQAPAPPPFNIEWKTSIESLIGGIFVAHSGLQTTISPIRLAIYLLVTNRQGMIAVIDAYSIEASQAPTGPWVTTPPVMWGADIFWIGAGLSQANALDLHQCEFDLKILNRSIQPGDVVGGWIFFDKLSLTPHYLRITLTDTKGFTYESIVGEPTTSYSVDAQPASMGFFKPPKIFDFSGMRIQE